MAWAEVVPVLCLAVGLVGGTFLASWMGDALRDMQLRKDRDRDRAEWGRRRDEEVDAMKAELGMTRRG